MKKYVPKLIVMTVLVTKAATEVIADYSHPMLLTAAIPLAFLALLMFKKVDVSLSCQIPWIMAVSVMIFYVLPLGALHMEILAELPSYLVNLLEAASRYNDWGIVALVIALALQIFFRNRKNMILIALRYLLLWVVFDAIRNGMFHINSNYYSGLTALLVCCCFAREAIAHLRGVFRPSFLRCLLLFIGAMLLYQLFGSSVSDKLNNMFQLNRSNWYISMTVALVLGILCLVDDYQCYNGDVFTQYFSGWMMVFWSLLLVVMQLFSGLFNQNLLLIGYPLACVLLTQWITTYQTKSKIKYKHIYVLFIALFGMDLLLMLLAKSIRLGLLCQWILIVATLVTTMNCKTILLGKLKRHLVDLILGLTAMLLLVTTRMTDWAQFLADPALLVRMVLCAVLWVLISAQVHRLVKSPSPIFQKEFQDAKVLCMTLPVLILCFWVIQMFFIL